MGINRDDWRFYVTYQYELEDENEDIIYDTLYALNMPKNICFWFDNETEEWKKSLYSAIDIILDKDFKEVSYWDNGIVNTDEALEPNGHPTYSLTGRFPELFGEKELGE
ncbi:MAG: hypothetical protein E7345_02115 [Clostridiales bacterium]|nr:hypothetical protein [Clostridiales bacterium]